MNVLFVCVANSGRSVMAERLFLEAARGRHKARSAGSEPGSAPHPRVVEALEELGIDASDHVPRKLDQEALDWADVAVSTCSDEVCPVTPGVRRISWEFKDPKNLPLDEVRQIRNQIDQRVSELIGELDREAATRDRPIRRDASGGCPSGAFSKGLKLGMRPEKVPESNG